jgi:hypothetical protein
MKATEIEINSYPPVASYVLVGYSLVALSSGFVGLAIGWLIWAH